MGYRLSKIYTRTGDQGTTGLGDGSRVEKNHPRIEAMGTLDELNSLLGLLLAQPNLPNDLNCWLKEIQHDLFDLGGELALPEIQLLQTQRIEVLEKQIEQMNDRLPPLKEFILPGGSIPASLCHLARSVCRRAERTLYTLMQSNPTAKMQETPMLPYLNRLSDWLFVGARTLARQEGNEEILWNRKR